jgi:hypothetical protein
MSYYTLVKRGHEGITATTCSFGSIEEAVDEAKFQIADIDALKEDIVTGPLQITICNDDQMPVAHISAFDKQVHYLKEVGVWSDPVEPIVNEFFDKRGGFYQVTLLGCHVAFYSALLVIGFMLMIGVFCLADKYRW